MGWVQAAPGKHAARLVPVRNALYVQAACFPSAEPHPSSHPQVMMKPGGHGVIWKLMIDTGVFDWLGAQGRQAAIVRQIRCAGCTRVHAGSFRCSVRMQTHGRTWPCWFCLPALCLTSLLLPACSNPMAGTDNTLLALAGAGFPQRRSFGFASCERAVGAAEGMNVLAQVRGCGMLDGAFVGSCFAGLESITCGSKWHGTAHRSSQLAHGDPAVRVALPLSPACRSGVPPPPPAAAAAAAVRPSGGTA